MTMLAARPTIPHATAEERFRPARGLKDMRLDFARDQFVGDLRDGTRKNNSRRCSPNTLRRYHRELTRFIDWLTATSPKGRALVQDFTAEAVQGYREHRMNVRRVAQNTLSLDSVILRAFSSWGATKKYWPPTVAEDVPYDGKPHRLPRPIPSSERDAIMALPLPPAEKALRALLYYVGLRNGEVTEIRLRDLSAPDRLATGEILPATVRIIGKGNRERVSPMHADAWAAIVVYLRTRKDARIEDRLFVKSDGSPWSDYMVQRRVAGWALAAGTAHHTPHEYRHTYATNLLESGADIRDVQELLGHASLATTAIYTKVTDKRKAAAALRLPSFGVHTPQSLERDSPTLPVEHQEAAPES